MADLIWLTWVFGHVGLRTCCCGLCENKKQLLRCLFRHWQIVLSWPCTFASKPREVQEMSLGEWNRKTQRLTRSFINNTRNAALVWMGPFATDGLHLGFRVNRISLLHLPYSRWLKLPPADTCDYPAATWYWTTISIMVTWGQITFFFFFCWCHKLKSAHH